MSALLAALGLDDRISFHPKQIDFTVRFLSPHENHRHPGPGDAVGASPA